MDLKSFRRAGHTPSLVAALAHFDVSFMAWVLLGAMGAYISDDLDLTASEKGLLVAVPLLAAAAFRVLLGVLGDAHGPKRVGQISLAIVMLPLLYGWLGAGSYAELIGVGVLLGGAGASFPLGLPPAHRPHPPPPPGPAVG